MELNRRTGYDLKIHGGKNWKDFIGNLGTFYGRSRFNWEMLWYDYECWYLYSVANRKPV